MRTKIRRLEARRVWDLAGKPTVEVEVELGSTHRGRGIASAFNAQTGMVQDLRDGGSILGGLGVDRAVDNVNETISRILIGMDAMDQQLIDETLVKLDGSKDKSRLGINAISATSLAVLKAAAASTGLPLWQYVAGGSEVTLPVPHFPFVRAGRRAIKRYRIRDLMVMPVGAETFGHALFIIAEISRIAREMKLGFTVGAESNSGNDFIVMSMSDDELLEQIVQVIDRAGYGNGKVMIALDIEFTDSVNMTNHQASLHEHRDNQSELLHRLGRWTNEYPVISIANSGGAIDSEGMIEVTSRLGERVQLIQDNIGTAEAGHLVKAIQDGIGNAVSLKVSDLGTVSETVQLFSRACAAGWGTVLSACSDTLDNDVMVHLATGMNLGQLRLGTYLSSDRMASFNEGLRVEDEFGTGLHFAGMQALPVNAMA